ILFIFHFFLYLLYLVYVYYYFIFIFFFLFFFFSSRRRHTRFDCDWSSDVCSSDLGCELGVVVVKHIECGLLGVPSPFLRSKQIRSEERRVGKECRSRWAPYN